MIRVRIWKEKITNQVFMTFINYRIHRACGDNFKSTALLLLSQLSDYKRIVSISFFTTLTNKNYHLRLVELHEIVTGYFDGKPPLLTLVAQSSENPNELQAEVILLSDHLPVSALHWYYTSEIRYCSIETRSFNAVITEGVSSSDYHSSIACQSTDVFNKISSLLQKVEMAPSHIIRQWNYIGNITGFDSENQHYQEFNNARAEFYATSEWKTGYPAATGISMDVDAVIVQVLAMQFYEEDRVFPVNNPLQIAAHNYSTDVLVRASEKQTPKFERAKLLFGEEDVTCYVSGTAAILGETSRNKNDIENQTLQTIQLINYLISDENIKQNGVKLHVPLKMQHLRVYVKQPEYFCTVRKLVTREWPEASVLYVCASVCRDELLVEIEGVALNNNLKMNV